MGRFLAAILLVVFMGAAFLQATPSMACACEDAVIPSSQEVLVRYLAAAWPVLLLAGSLVFGSLYYACNAWRIARIVNKSKR